MRRRNCFKIISVDSFTPYQVLIIHSAIVKYFSKKMGISWISLSATYRLLRKPVN